jgi:3-hydroxyisobutyrate dehydrogenase-like beta-hydroxyacid dehydrogenase
LHQKRFGANTRVDENRIIPAAGQLQWAIAQKDHSVMQSIGLIGVGLMGHGIASNILKHGFTLTALEHPGNQPLDSLVERGLKLEKAATALAQNCDVIILCVTGSPQVEQVLTDPQGLLAGLQPGAMVIDCSTALPASTLRMAQLVQQKGGHFVDAPMTRTAKEAAEGRLNLLVGADPIVFSQCEPLLRAFAENITHVGAIGAGHQMKLLHNFVSLGTATLIAEAAACAAHSAIDPAVFVEVLSKGGGAGVALERLKPYILNSDANSLKFTIANALKDLSYYDQMASDSGARHTIAESVKTTLSQAVNAGHGNAFVPALIAALKA